MPKFIIFYDSGFSNSKRVVEAQDEKDALRIAYAEMMEEFESNSNYAAMPLTEEAARKHGLEMEKAS